MDSGPRPKPQRLGRYWLFRQFARGGMASVHLGRMVGPAGFSRLVALKVLHPLCADDEHITMLLDEARLSSRIRHPNVVQTLDVVHDGQQVCIVMEYVHGVDFATAVSAARRRRERVPPAVASAIVGGVLQGLHAAHEARGEDGLSLGIVHRDISPQNVVVGVDGMARVLDFGVAKALRKDHVTLEGRVKGKIAYMAPEQLAGVSVTRQADVYAAGVVLWEALAGRRLFEEQNEARLIARVLGEPIPAPSGFTPGIGPELDAIVLRAVAPERRERFASAQEMASALSAAIAPATSEEVAAWLERMAGDEIEARTELVSEAETFVDEPPGSPTHDAFDVSADPSHGEIAVSLDAALVATGPSDGQDTVIRRIGRRHAFVAIGLVAVSAALALSRAPGIVRAFTATSSTQVAEAPPGMRPAASPPVAPQEPARAIEPLPATLVMAPVQVPAPMKASTRLPRRHVTGHASRPACDPPYTIDENGLKHYKAGCLQ